MARIPLFLLLLVLPLAVAGQNIGTGVVAAILFVQIFLRRRQARAELSDLWRSHRGAVLASGAFIGCVLLGGLLNPARPDGGGSFLFGYLSWALLPPVACLAQGRLERKDWERLLACFAFVTLVMGGVAAAQAVWGFKVVGSHFVSGSTRSQGFYSHPLTFAYVALLMLPVGCVAVTRRPKGIAGWIILVSTLVMIYASQSRTVQAVAALVVLVNILRFTSGRLRVGLLVAAIAAGGIVWVTDNPVSRKFKGTLAGGFDVRSDYADDRLAFWTVAVNMIKERPLLGHGENLDTAYRKPYYEAIGLGGFERMYEAHDMYLQAAVNGGLLGLAAFLAWYVWMLRRARAIARGEEAGLGGEMALQALVALALAAVTQNAIQDSEVRYTLTLLCIGVWFAAPRRVDAVGGDGAR
jgi:O-antigen ligase